MSDETKIYELGFLLKSEGDRKEITEAIKHAGFDITNDGQVSSVKLAYPIKKQNFAQFGYIYFSGEPDKINNLKDELKVKTGVLRFTVFANPIIKKKEDEFARAERFSAEAERRAPVSENQEIKERKQTVKPPRAETLSNEDLEKRLEEILK